MNGGTTAALYFYDACIRGDKAMCAKGRKHIRYGPGLIRPWRIRLTYAPRSKTLAVYAFGELMLYEVKPTGLALRTHVKNAFYRDRDWFIRGGAVAIAPGGSRVAIGGASGLARVYDSHGRLQYDFMEPSRQTAQLWPRAQSSRLAFGPLDALLVSHGATVFRVDAKGRGERWFSLVNGRALQPTALITSAMRTWNIEGLKSLGMHVIIRAEGRLIVLDYNTLKGVGWIGPPPGSRLGHPAMLRQ